jgi:4-hydroxy-3-methylbut-2-enyl diphosphate reductase
VVIHGKPKHEETRATFSHARSKAPSFVVTDMAETEMLSAFIEGKRPMSELFDVFDPSRASAGFDPERDFERVGVVNQTTMLAEDTQAIADRIKTAMVVRYGEDKVKDHFADTRDTLCYATTDNQTATAALLEQPADVAFVIGGTNSSNTSHLVELCELKVPTYFIQQSDDLISDTEIQHFDLHTHAHQIKRNYLPVNEHPVIILTSGASCPDSLLEAVMQRILSFYGVDESAEGVIHTMSQGLSRYA